MNLQFESLNHSRQAGMFTINGIEASLVDTVKTLAVEGIDTIESDEGYEGYYIAFTYDKEMYSRANIRKLWKEFKTTTLKGE